MKTTFNRRTLLRGSGGFTLALPLLPSLLSEKWALGDAAIDLPKRFFAFRTDHGAVRPDWLFPAESMLTERQALYPGHEVRRGSLVRSVDGTDAFLSRWLKAKSSALTDRLVAKTNVLAGLDVPWYCGHNQGLMLGNFARSNTENSLPNAATLDQVLAWSPSFYAKVPTVRQRVTVFGHPYSPSFSWTKPSERSGDIVHQPPTAYSAREMFRRLFDQQAPVNAPAPRKPVIDRVLADWKRLRNGNERLSTLDKQRLDSYVDRLAELDRTINAAPAPLSCRTQAEPADIDVRTRAGLDLMIDIIAAAFACGSSHIFVGHAGDTWPFDEMPDWHGVAHSSYVDAGAEQKMLEHHRWCYENIFLKLAAKLDTPEANGKTYLDNSLLMFAMECGPHTHEDQSIPVVTMGSAGGSMKTGSFCDYRNVSASSLRKFSGSEGFPMLYTGLTYNQFLATGAQAMGLTPSQFELGGKPGFGITNVDAGYQGKMVPGVVQHASDWLPFLRA